MGIKVTFTRGNIDYYLQKRLENYRRALIAGLVRIGELTVNEARLRGRYKDRTGNLRSSIGYCVLDNGATVIESSFEVEKGVYEDERGKRHPYSGDEGSRKGREFLHSLTDKYSSGLVLLVVAGMEYAAYVEAKNLNVLDSAEQLAEREVPRMLEDLKLNK